MGLASGLSYAVYMVLARLATSRGAGAAEVGVFSIPWAALALLAVVRPRGLPGGTELAYMAYLGIFTTLIPYLMHVKALSLIEAHRVSVISLVEPVVAIVAAGALLGEELSPVQVAGSALVLAASAATILALIRG